jgi:lipopolysaccharide/colanic/teichoic acid biosynthesis glycosyltransferase
MLVGAETASHEAYLLKLMQAPTPMTKMDSTGDPRLIPGGCILRASGLDELPQFINVLRGEMSLVGPRPCTGHEFQNYAPWQCERVNALPGLTGSWQVNGKNRTTFDEMIRMDIDYARRVSILGDLHIILKTIPVLGAQCLQALRSKCARKRPGDRLTSNNV